MKLPAVSSGTLLGFLFYHLLVPLLQDLQDLRVQPGANVTLRCQEPRRGAVTLLTWTRTDLQKDDYAFFYRDKRPYERFQHQSFRGRAKLRDASSMEDGDFSILLQNVSFQDAGTYECRVVMREPGGADGRRFDVKHLVNLTVSGDEEPEEEGEEEEGREKVGVVILGEEGTAVLVVSLLVLFLLLFGLAFGLRRRCSLTACMDVFHRRHLPPAEPEAVKQPLQLRVSLTAQDFPGL